MSPTVPQRRTLVRALTLASLFPPMCGRVRHDAPCIPVYLTSIIFLEDEKASAAQGEQKCPSHQKESQLTEVSDGPMDHLTGLPALPAQQPSGNVSQDRHCLHPYSPAASPGLSRFAPH